MRKAVSKSGPVKKTVIAKPMVERAVLWVLLIVAITYATYHSVTSFELVAWDENMGEFMELIRRASQLTD